MSTAPLAKTAGGQAVLSLLDRVTRALPVTIVFAWLVLLYAWESTGHTSPWLFSDELQNAQLSRAIAATGHAARRGMPYGFHTLYNYLVAPAWWLGSIPGAYTATKYIGAATMTASIFPTYGLARMVVSKRAALFAAAAAGAAPALAYSPMLLDEPLAYPYAAFAFFVIAKALATRNRWWIAGAIAVVVVAPFVRGELAVLPAILALAALFLVWTGEQAGRWRRNWTAWDWTGAIVLGIGVVVLVSAALGRGSATWLIATGHYRGRMIEYGLWAAGALVIGVGVLPLIAGLGALFRRRGEARSQELRAFTAVACGAIVCFGMYTAVKAAYLSTIFGTRVEERNLIYVVPLLAVATALWLERPRLRLVPLACLTGFAAYLIVSTPYQMNIKIDSDALGLSMLQMWNWELGQNPPVAEWILVGVLALLVGLVLAPRFLGQRTRAATAVVWVTAGLALAWTLTGQISAGQASNSFSRSFVQNFPHPPDWVDRVVHGAPTVYLGQSIDNPNGVWLLEFWNKSIRYVWSLDGTAPGPGPVLAPDINGGNGQFNQQRGDIQYAVIDPGMDVVGKVVALGPHASASGLVDWRLVKIDYPLRLKDAITGIFADGWMSRKSTYSLYTTASKARGFVTVNVSRRAWGGVDVPGHVRIVVGHLVLDNYHPALGEVTAVRTWTVHAHEARTFVIPTPKPPFRVEVTISPTFRPSDLDPRTGDTRELGAIVSYSFSPSVLSR